MFGPGPPIWDWTRNKHAANSILKNRRATNKTSKGASSLEKKIINTLLSLSLLIALAYIIFNSF